MTLSFFLKKQASGKLYLTARFFNGLKSVYKPTGFLAHKITDWNKNTHRLEGNLSANSLIAEWEKKFGAYLTYCEDNQLTPEFDKAAQAICGDLKLKGFTLQDAVQAYIDHLEFKGKVTRKYTILLNTVISYEKELGREVKLAGINGSLCLNVATHCTKFLKNENSTTKKKIQYLMKALKHAKSKGMIAAIPDQESLDLDTPPSSRHPLEEDELTILKNYEPRNKAERIVYDAFLFGCETGLRYSDVINIAPINVLNKNGKTYLNFLMVKSRGKKPIVPLSEYAQKILGKYLKDLKTPYFNELPTNQEVNRTLKEIFDHAELKRICIKYTQKGRGKATPNYVPMDELAHFHMARHTCATLLIERGVKIADVKLMLGHSKIDTTMKYIKVNEEDAMDNLRAALDVKPAVIKSMENKAV